MVNCMRIVVIGGGPSGMMAAISSKKHHPESEVFLLERNKLLGKKMRLTGGGRCNVTANVEASEVVSNTPKNGRFLYSALSNFNPQKIITFFEDNGCPLKEEDHGRMFPESNRSKDIVETLQNVLIKSGVKILYDQKVNSIDLNPKKIHTETDTFTFDKLILCAGGKTLPGTGSDGSGYDLVKQMGHSVTDILPAEVPLVSNDTFIQEKVLQGLSFQDVNVKVYHKKKIKSNITHDLLFTHFGLSGPAALRSSFEVQKLLGEPIELSIDFFPEASTLDETHFNYQKRLIDYVSSLEGDLWQNLKNFKMSVYDTRGFKYAFVSNGGVSLKEVDPKTMKSKLNSDISIAGELLDMSSFTGGYNITSALVSGYTAGKFVSL